MPRYYISSPETTLGISAVKAQQMGCKGVTSFWWSVIAHPTSGEYALSIPDEELILDSAVYDEEGVLVTPAETVKVLYSNGNVQITTNGLNTEAYMNSNGWFPAEDWEKRE